MMDVTFEFPDKHGRKVRSLADAILPSVQDLVTDRVRHARCPAHGGGPRNVSTFKVGSEIRWKAHLCCVRLRDAIQQSLS